jgi:hypothetical protein
MWQNFGPAVGSGSRPDRALRCLGIEWSGTLEQPPSRLVSALLPLLNQLSPADRAAPVRVLTDTPPRGKARQRSARLLPGDGRDERIAKYERHLHNLLTSTLHELERLQARRAGEAIGPPAVADVTVTIDTGHG